MGKYSSVNASYLRSAANTALTELNRNDLMQIQRDISNKSILDASVSAIIKGNLSSINTNLNIVGSIAVIQKMLRNLVTASYYIDKYQDLERTISRLEGQKYRYETDYYYTTSASGARVRKSRQTKTINTSVMNQISRNERLLQQYEEKIDELLAV